MSQQPKRTMYQEKMSQQPKRTMYPEMMRQHPNRTGTSSQSNLLRAEGSVHRSDTRPSRAHCSPSVLSNAVSALLAGHAPAAPVNPLVQQPTMVNRMVPAGGAGGDMNQRRMVMEMRQQLQKVAPPYTGFKSLAPPPGFPPRPQTVNTRLELQPPTSSLSMPVGSYHHNHLGSYSHGDQAARGITGGAVNPTVQQQLQQVDKGKRPLLGDQVNTNYNPYEQAAKKRAIENTSKPKYNPITQRMMDMKADAQRNEIKLLHKMPSVSAKGIGPDSRKVQGFLYSYGLQENNGDDVKIMCNCHAALLSPADFVKHAGGGDVADPLKHISVNVLVSAPPDTL